MRFAPIILFLGILFNVACVVVFRLRLDRKYQDRLNECKESLAADVRSLSADALLAIDRHLATNLNQVVASSVSASREPPPRSFSDAGEWLFHYSELRNVRYATVGSRHYREGDIFPRGGIITSIHPDGVLVDGQYWFRNFSTTSPRLTSTSNPIKGDTET